MKSTIFTITALLFLASCAPKLTFTWVKEGYEGKKYKKIAIFSFTKNLEASARFQDNMVKYLSAEGYTAVAGMSIINPVQMRDLKPDDINRILRNEDVDAVISVMVVDKETSVDYVHGTSYGYGYPYRGGFGAYYGYRYGPGYYDPGYYQESKTYLLENHFYEVIKGESSDDLLVWASQSSLTDPSSNTSKVYSKVLIQALQNDGVLK